MWALGALLGLDLFPLGDVDPGSDLAEIVDVDIDDQYLIHSLDNSYTERCGIRPLLCVMGGGIGYWVIEASNASFVEVCSKNDRVFLDCSDNKFKVS